MRAGVEAIHFKKVLAITNREEAIKTACSLSENGDIVLVAVKGHEKYQEIKGVRHDCSVITASWRSAQSFWNPLACLRQQKGKV